MSELLEKLGNYKIIELEEIIPCSVTQFYDIVGKEIDPKNFDCRFFNPECALISLEIRTKFEEYYKNRGLSLNEISNKLSTLGPRVCNELHNYEVAYNCNFVSKYKI